MSEVQRADSSARRAAIVVVGCGAAAGVVIIALATRLRPDVTAWLLDDPEARLPMVIAATIAMTTGPALGAAIYVWRLGRRVVRTERFPPPGLRVTRDTPVVTGTAAGRRGRLIQAFAIALGVLAAVMALTLWRLANAARFGAGPGT
jgi:hypothetical protein